MTRSGRANGADELRDYARYGKDAAFVRKFEAAICKLVELRMADMNLLWRFKECIRPSGQPDESRLPMGHNHRRLHRSWEPNWPRPLYAMLWQLIWNWWEYKNGRFTGPNMTLRRERKRKAAFAALDRLWLIIKNKNERRTVGAVDKGYTVRPAK